MTTAPAYYEDGQVAAQRTGRRYIGIVLNREYLALTLKTRLAQAALDFEEPA